MKKIVKIAVWVAIAIVGAILTHTNPLWWLVAVIVGKVVIRLILTIVIAVILYVMFYALIIAGVLWILIN